jgi:hypothetical protein
MAKFIRRMREADEKTLFFIEGDPQGGSPRWSGEQGGGVINASHCYDGVTLFTKSFRPYFNVDVDTTKPVFGRKGVARMYERQFRLRQEWARRYMGGIPSLLGEFGIPFDMDHRRAYRSGDYRRHEEALSMYYDALDALFLHGTIWNYSVTNNHEYGDNWNGEDLSIYSAGEGRAMGGWLRPYPLATAGLPQGFSWNRKTGTFRYAFTADPAIPEPTEIFAPPECFGNDPALSLQGGNLAGKIETEYDAEARRIFIRNRGYSGKVELTARRVVVPRTGRLG